MLAQLGEDGLPNGRFLHRDLGGFNIDFAHQQTLGLPQATVLPVVESLEADYHTGSHERSMRHLRLYFVAGFVHNLEAQLPSWEKVGWVARAPAAGALRQAMADELSTLHQALTGEPFEVDPELEAVPALVKSARAAVVAARK